MINDPKYIIDSNRHILNMETKTYIPDDEPILILRAKDKNAALTIAYYKKLCRNEEHRKVVNARLHEFVDFAHNYPELMKEPD